MSEFKITLGVDVQVGDIQSQINSATDNLKPIELDIKLNGIDKELKSAIKDAQQAGKLISDSVGNSMNKVMSKSIRKPFQVTSHDSKEFERQMNGLVSKWTNGKGNLVKVDIDTKTVFDEEKGHNIEKLHKAHVTYNNDLGETIKKTVALNQIGKDAKGNPIFGFVEVAGKYSKTLDKTKTQTGNFIKQQKQAAANLTNQINQLNRAANDQNAARPIKDEKNLTALQNKYNDITTAIQRMRSASSDTFIDEQNNVKALISEYKSMVSEFRNAENVANKLKGTDFKSGKEIAKNNLNKFKADAKEFPQIAKTIAQLDAAIEKVGDKSSLDDFNNQLKVAKSELSKVKAEADAVKKATSIQNKLKDTGYDGFTEEVARAKAEVDKLKISSGEVEVALTRLDNAMAGVNAANETGDVKQLISANKEYEAALKSLYSQIKLNQQVEKQNYDNEGLELSKAKALLKLENLFESGSQAAKRYGAEMQNLQKEIADCANMADMSHINDKIDILDKQVDRDGLQRQTFGSRIKAQFQKYSQYFSVAQAMMYAGQALRDMFQQVVAIDTAMTELKKVTDETDASYDRFLKNAAARSKEIGTTIDGLVTSTADFARLGYSFEQSAGLAEVANIYTVVGDEIDGVETATQSLVSTLAAFKHEMGDMSDSDFAMSIVDKFNEVSNNFAISSGGIGEALQRSASSLAAANNTLDESIALITAANTVVQNPEKVGKLAMPT